MLVEDLIVKAIDVLSQSMRQVMRKYKEESPEESELFNLTITQLHYLYAIREMRNPTYTELAQKFNVQKSTVTVTINKLIQRDYIYKTQSVDDLRVFHLQLSPKGQRLMEIEDQGYRQFATQITACLDDSQKEEFAKLLLIIAGSSSRG
ncbi:MarR family winged helix-turn-helix transcriptional regulator [Pelosinus sp. sgz500959]|uniref:MarR family winged helix-turn-helix transcriptional regulator n=1 Tax=Pelosinus sp. sgz500959 TaxID=3242472 RepID=UPI00366DC9DC